jgi:hypothetical protein
VPERVCWFKSSPQQSKSLRCIDLPGGTEEGPQAQASLLHTVRSIRRHQIESWIMGLYKDSGLVSAGLNRILDCMKVMMKEAVRKRYANADPAAGVESSMSEASSPLMRFMRSSGVRSSRRLEAYRGANLFRRGDLDEPFLSLFITRRAVGSSTMRSCMYPAASALRSASALDLPETTQMERATFL